MAEPQESSNAGASDARSEAMPAVRRVAHFLGMIVVGAVIPAAVAAGLVGALGVSALFTGVLWGALGAKLGGTRRMAYVAPVVGIVAGLGAYTAYGWWWAVLLAAVGLLSGVGFRFGWFPVMLMAPFAATLVTPTSSASDAVIFGTVVAVGTGYGIIIVRRFGAPPVVDGDHHSWPVTAVIALMFGGVMGAAASLGVALAWSEPYWVPEPVLILVMYLLLGRRERIREKAVGTACGAAAAALVASVALPAWALTALALLAFLGALMQRKTYWRMYGLYTFALVLYSAAPDDVAFVAEQRGFQFLAGIGLLALGLLAVHAIADQLARRYPQPELAPVAAT
ncbi:FUSC family protein [Microbacterium sp. R86528]|uniref:FUSC family protein n=1 Tax=Microbacterium sp. R86528 TaxID=3093864 RepID=UPI0037CB1153